MPNSNDTSNFNSGNDNQDFDENLFRKEKPPEDINASEHTQTSAQTGGDFQKHFSTIHQGKHVNHINYDKVIGGKSESLNVIHEENFDNVILIGDEDSNNLFNNLNNFQLQDDTLSANVLFRQNDSFTQENFQINNPLGSNVVPNQVNTAPSFGSDPDLFIESGFSEHFHFSLFSNIASGD